MYYTIHYHEISPLLSTSFMDTVHGFMFCALYSSTLLLSCFNVVDTEYDYNNNFIVPKLYLKMYYVFIVVNDELSESKIGNSVIYSYIFLSSFFFSLWTSWLEIGSLPCHERFCCKYQTRKMYVTMYLLVIIY